MRLAGMAALRLVLAAAAGLHRTAAVPVTMPLANGTTCCYLRGKVNLAKCTEPGKQPWWTVYTLGAAGDWTQHAGINCVGFKISGPDPFSNSISLAGCQAACQSNPQCHAIVVETPGTTNPKPPAPCKRGGPQLGRPGWRPLAAPGGPGGPGGPLGGPGGPGGPLGSFWRPWRPAWWPLAAVAARLMASGGLGGPLGGLWRP
eukprot:gene12178-biopygen13300